MFFFLPVMLLAMAVGVRLPCILLELHYIRI